MYNMGLEVVHIDVNDEEIDVTNTEKLVKIDKNKVKTDRSMVLTLFNKGTPMFVEFYANWCGHCKTLAPEWKKLTNMLEKDYKDKSLAIVSVESNVIHKDITNVLTTIGLEVNGFPTIGLIKDKKFIVYKGGRDAKNMLEFIKKEAWGIMEGGRQSKHRQSKHRQSKYRQSKKSKHKHSRKSKHKHSKRKTIKNRRRKY
jgi:thiol-disulfide isomerase/thioredoxin